MDINASTASQAYTAAKPAVEGTQGAAQSGQSLPVSQTTQTRQLSFETTSSSPAFVLDISEQVLKVELISDMSTEDQQYWLGLRQQFADKLEAQGLSVGQEGWGHKLDGKDITFGQGDGTTKTLRADGYVVTTRTDMTQDQQNALTRYFAETDADRAAEYSSGATASGQFAPPAAEPAQATPSPAVSPTPSNAAEISEQVVAAPVPYDHASDQGIRVAKAILTDDNHWEWREITSELSEETLAQYRTEDEQRRAADEQQKKEAAGRAAGQEEWGKKWGVGAKAWTGPMTSSERVAAEEVAMAEVAMSSTRLDISTANRLAATVKKKESDLATATASGTSIADKLSEELAAARTELETMIQGFLEEQQRFTTAYSFKLRGNLVERGEDGRFREGTYTLTKEGSGWAMRIDSNDGLMVSIDGQAFTHDFKRVVVRDVGPSPIQLESREESARRVALMG